MKEILVFGSNQAGRHGKGAALFAKKHYGAEYGVGEGHTGASYAIPTKDFNMRVRPLEEIQKSVSQFLDYAEDNPELSFLVTRIGCGLAGYKDYEIGPMFKGYPSNVELPIRFLNACKGTS